MAWFDYLAGIGQGLGQASQQGLKMREQAREEARQEKADAILQARADREKTEFDQRRAEALYKSLPIGTELDPASEEGKLLLKYRKTGLTTGKTPGTLSVLEDAERKQTRLENELAQKRFDAEVRKFGVEEATFNLLKPFRDALGDPTKLQTVQRLPMVQRRMAGAQMGDPSLFLTMAERAAEARLSPAVQAELIQSGTQLNIAGMPQRIPPGQITTQRIDALKAQLAGITERLKDLALSPADKARLEQQYKATSDALNEAAGVAMPATQSTAADPAKIR